MKVILFITAYPKLELLQTYEKEFNQLYLGKAKGEQVSGKFFVVHQGGGTTLGSHLCSVVGAPCPLHTQRA